MDAKALLDMAETNNVCVVMKTNEDIMDALDMCEKAGRMWAGGEELFNTSIIRNMKDYISVTGYSYIAFYEGSGIKFGDATSVNIKPNRRLLSLRELILQKRIVRFKY